MPARWLAGLILGLAFCCLGFCKGAVAQMPASPPSSDQASGSGAASGSSHEGDFWTRDALTGNWGGTRSTLEDEGVVLAADSIDEVLGNVAGGVGKGAIYDGRLELIATLDLQKLLSWTGATFHTNVYQIYGRGLSANYLGTNLMTPSNIEAMRATRLFDLWVEQVLFDGKLSIRAGQIAADDEFFISNYASNFINATFGWPAIMSSDLPSGGPAYPLATPGLRIAVAPTDAITWSAAVFNGDPAGSGPGNPEGRDAGGTAFRFNDNAFAITEASYAVNQQQNAPGLPATYKLGAWYAGAPSNGSAFDLSAQAIASSAGVAPAPADHYGFYLVVDHGVWQGHMPERSIGAFLRVGANPSDRGPVSFYADGGINVKGLIPQRGDDVFGVGIALARIGNRTRDWTDTVSTASGIALPVPLSEGLIEATYRYQATPWWNLQPDLQFIRHPGGHVGLPSAPDRAIPNAVVLGLRSAVLF